MTYVDIAEKYDLDVKVRQRFLMYMYIRWGNPVDEDIKCTTGYAGEWADRFKLGIEAQASDSKGREVLKRIDELL